MPSDAVPRNSHWSWTALVREHGEEEAFALLPDMPGIGSFDPTAGWAPHPWRFWDTGWLEPREDEVHDELPTTLCPTSPLDLDLGALQADARSYWRHETDGSLSVVPGRPSDVGDYLGVPWLGEEYESRLARRGSSPPDPT